MDDETYLLDLLNSTPIVDYAPTDLLGAMTAAKAWLRAHDQIASTREAQAIVAARDVLQAVVRGEKSVSALAPVLVGVSSRPHLGEDGVGWELDLPHGRTAAVRAVLAWDAVRRDRPGRLRACENPACALFLLDRSKPNNARWCSMATCGNRMKARRHYARVRGQA